MRTALALYVLALVARAAAIALYPDPAYPDSYYYVDVARSIAAGHGLTVDFIWIFAEVGNRIPDPAVLPIPSNAHWLPLASFIQAPFIAVLGPTPFASALPLALIGSLAAPLTWLIARDAGARPVVASAAGVLAAVPGAATVFMAQPENFALLQPLVAATLWGTARGLRGDGRSFAMAGLLAGLAAPARNDGILLGGAVGLVWLADRVRWLLVRRGRGSWSHVDDRPPIPALAGILALAGFLLVMGPWWARQLLEFGSISPTSASGAALWLRQYQDWNSITADHSLAGFLAQGPGPIIESRLAGLSSALGNFVVFVCSVVLVPFLVVGAIARRKSPNFRPWFLYTLIAFAGATLLYPLHVPGGAFIHSAIGLQPHAAILSVEGILLVVGWLAGRRRHWDEGVAGKVFVWGIVAFVIATSVALGLPVQDRWDSIRQPRIALAAELTRRQVPTDDRILSIDAAGIRYWTGHPGVVTPDDPIDVIEAVARAYDTRWLVLEPGDAARAFQPILTGSRPAWIGKPVFTVADPGGGSPSLLLYPLCFETSDSRCSGT
ncbi:MAG: ArnT family glycosyltransferase [Chloroflexota bacterium]